MFTNLSLSTHKILTPSFQHKKTNNQHSFVVFFSGELTQLRIHFLRCPGVEVTDKTVKLSRYARSCYISAKFAPHHIVFPLRSLRGRCRLRQMRCKYIRAVGATLFPYVSVLPVSTGRDTAIYVFVQCECASKKAPLKKCVCLTAKIKITPHPSPR